MKLPTSAEMIACDRATIAAGTASIDLMETAGRAVFERMLEVLKENRSALSAAPPVILCGPGNNGGDGLVIARAMRRKRFLPDLIVAASSRYSPEFIAQAELYCGESGVIKVFPKPEAPIGSAKLLACDDKELLKAISAARVVVDALLGTGQSQNPRAPISTMIEVLESVRSTVSRPFVVSVDIPTGVDCDSGMTYSPCVTADLTVTIELIKRGLLQSPASEKCGRLEVVSAGIGTSTESEFALLAKGALPRFPIRNRDAHKGNTGRVLVIGGCTRMPGAPVLAAFAALRAGAGLVTVTHSVPVQRPHELLVLPLLTGVDGTFQGDSVNDLAGQIELADVLVLGPGVGLSRGTHDFIIKLMPLLKSANRSVIIDADALTILAQHKELLPLGENFVITPHPGEASRILDCSVSEVQKDRYHSAQILFERTRAIVVLKGASTVIYHDKKGWVNSTGNAWMATAGSGDVLSGIIAALDGQGLSLLEASALGVFVHGDAGDRASSTLGGPIIASDIITKIPETIGALLT